MIKVNLYPEARIKAAKKPRKEASSVRTFLMLLAAIALAAAAVATGGVLFLKMHVADLRERIDENRKTLASYQQKNEEVKRYEKLNAEYAQKSGVIEALRSNQSVPVKMLAELSATLPEGVWLSSLSYKGDLVTVEGYAFSNFEIVNYVENLKKSPSLHGVYLQETKEAEYHQTTVYKFIMSMKMKA